MKELTYEFIYDSIWVLFNQGEINNAFNTNVGHPCGGTDAPHNGWSNRDRSLSTPCPTEKQSTPCFIGENYLECGGWTLGGVRHPLLATWPEVTLRRLRCQKRPMACLRAFLFF